MIFLFFLLVRLSIVWIRLILLRILSSVRIKLV